MIKEVGESGYERLAVLEAEVRGIREQHKAHKDETFFRFNSIDSKLDKISESLNKGRGVGAVFVVIGTAIMGGVVYLLFGGH